ncbi:MAG: hypothetical protein ACXAAN_14800 [Candidatus Thorarchaeota archaeon]|jgi:hypothetical protein
MRKLERLDKRCDELIRKFYEDEKEWEAFRDMYQIEWRIDQIQKLIDDASEIIKALRDIEDYYYDHPEEIESGTGNLDDEIRPWADRKAAYIQMKKMEEFPEEKKKREFTDEEEDRWSREMGEHE